MLQGWIIIAVALGYLGLLFAFASYGDKISQKKKSDLTRQIIYALTITVYCTSWTFFGSVGLASRSGLDFLPIYIGPILIFLFARPVLKRIITLSKQENITSIADFIAARYGKSQPLAAAISVIAVIGTLPYISLQLKAISVSLDTLVDTFSENLSKVTQATPIFSDLSLWVAVIMAGFAVLFGTRHIDTTEHQDGLMFAIAFESVVKIFAFISVGIFVTFIMFDGIEDLASQVTAKHEIKSLFSRGLEGGKWLTMTLLSMFAIFLLPRQFHVTIVENRKTEDIDKAGWMFPLYLIAINLFVVPIAIAGLLSFPQGGVDGDSFVLALPLLADQNIITLIAFIGGLSAASAMIIVSTVALSIMVCNDLIVPLILRRPTLSHNAQDNFGPMLLKIRRWLILFILLLAYIYYRYTSDTVALASFGLLSFAAFAQFAPAFFIGMVWRRATAKGAFWAITAGFLVWGYTLVLPSFAESSAILKSLLENGPFGITLLKPQFLFHLHFDPLTHGVFWSLLINIVIYFTVSLLTKPSPIERLQAGIFVNADIPPPVHGFRLWRTSISIGDLKSTVSKYIGPERTERSFAEFMDKDSGMTDSSEADLRMLRHAEFLLASSVGTASSRLIMGLLIERHSFNKNTAMQLLDDASSALQYNRDLLQSALNHVLQGIAVFDKDLRLICWNRQFRHLLNLPDEFGRVGVPLQEIISHNANRGDFGDGDPESLVSQRVQKLIVSMEPFQEYFVNDDIVLEVHSTKMPDGGIVITYTDITDRVEASNALKTANENLEKRVKERTSDLTKLNHELARAKSSAEEANQDKTRFLAAAGHDILQPLNAARLYASTLAEKPLTGHNADLAQNVDSSLEAVEDIIGALLDISRLDAGALEPEISNFRLDELFSTLKTEFDPLATRRDLELTVMPCALTVHTDRRLLRRVLQNFISNALKYCEDGRVLVGTRRDGDMLRIEVHDTGFGIPESEKKLIFKEFQRLDSRVKGEPGLGLGLSIVERIGHVLAHKVSMTSEIGHGSVFSITVPISSAAPVSHKNTRRPETKINSLKGVSILCIDNENTILEGMKALLGGWGCHVITATEEQSAIENSLQTGKIPDIILADYHLEKSNGLDTVMNLRWQFKKDIPAALITADRSLSLREQAEARDMIVLNKPVKPAALRAFLNRNISRLKAAE